MGQDRRAGSDRREPAGQQSHNRAVAGAAPRDALPRRRCHLALLDTAATGTLLREADEIFRRRPDLGVFVRQAEDLRAELAQVKGNSVPGASALTAAELRLLPLLSTHLSLPEIAQEMFLSPNTIKSQAYSMYRKLGVSSRSQAVAQAGKLALLEP
jgi:LuxR family maltose regulon positive regulatory protein